MTGSWKRCQKKKEENDMFNVQYVELSVAWVAGCLSCVTGFLSSFIFRYEILAFANCMYLKRIEIRDSSYRYRLDCTLYIMSRTSCVPKTLSLLYFVLNEKQKFVHATMQNKNNRIKETKITWICWMPNDRIINMFYEYYVVSLFFAFCKSRMLHVLTE